MRSFVREWTRLILFSHNGKSQVLNPDKVSNINVKTPQKEVLRDGACGDSEARRVLDRNYGDSRGGRDEVKGL